MNTAPPAHESATASALTIAITSTFTAEPVEEPLVFWAEELGLPWQCAFAPYNQVFQQLLDPASLVAQNAGGVNAILLRLEDWERPEARAAAGQPLGREAMARLEGDLRQVARAVKSLADRSPAAQFLCVCPPSTTAAVDPARAAFFGQMERLLASELRALPGVSLVTPHDLAATYPVSAYDDPHADALGHVPYTPAFFAALGTLLARRIHALVTPPRKVIVLDCDQTLWTGICGEDGPLGVAIDPARRALQEFLVGRQAAGMLLCLCSKNAEDDVLAVFDRHPHMVLRRGHLADWRINWQAKSENLRALAADLRLGTDSFIFLDDDPLECAEVQANAPEVLTLRLPAPDQISRFLAHVWAFDRPAVTAEDRRRTALYQTEAQRERLRAQAGSLEDFLEGLGLEVRIPAMAPEHLPRVAQLTQRTNQFNCTAIRRTEPEIREACRAGAECLVVHVTDRFGDYGLVGVLLFRIAADRLAVDTFLLSCRAMGRGVEHRMLAALGEIAGARGCAAVEVPYHPTPRNQPAHDFLHGLGVPPDEGGEGGLRFVLPVDVAASARYRPQAGPLVEAEAPATRDNGTRVGERPAAPPPPSVPVAPPGNRAAMRIATELTDAEHILRAIQARKRRARPGFEAGRPGGGRSAGGPTADVLPELLGLVDRLSDHEVEEMLARRRQPRAGGPVERRVIAEAVYRCADIEMVPVGADAVLVYCRTTRSARLLPRDLADVLSRCREFKPLERHARDLCAEAAEGPEAPAIATQRSAEAILRHLVEYAESGLLISRRELLDRCARPAGTPAIGPLLASADIPRRGAATPPPQDPSEPPIASVGIITANRPQAAARSLASYIENARRYGKTNDFIVVDDSSTPQARQACRDLLRPLKSRYGAGICYAGHEEKTRFAEALIARGGFPPDLVRFALFGTAEAGFSGGGNRNALHLHTVGDLIFSADDDTVCRLAPHPGEGGVAPAPDGGRLSFGAGCDPSNYWVFGDRQAALRAAQAVEADLLGMHERLLGKSVAGILADAAPPEGVSFDGLDADFLGRLEGGGGRVLATFNGLLGDCGWGAPFGFWGSPMGYLLLTGHSHERLVRSEAAYRAACTSRDILRVVQHVSITDESFGMTTFLGIDYRRPLPPFFPVGRGSDLIFAESVWRCMSNGLFGHLPWALLHEPVETRRFSPGEIFRTASGFDMPKLMLACIASCPFGPGQADPAERLRTLGRHLAALGSLPLADFEEVVRLQAWRSSRAHIALAEARLRECGESPAFWAKDVRRYLDLLCPALVREDYVVPLELVQGRSVEEARRLSQRLVGQFGQLLTLWPEMLEVAGELRRKGRRLGVPI